MVRQAHHKKKDSENKVLTKEQMEDRFLHTMRINMPKKFSVFTFLIIFFFAIDVPVFADSTFVSSISEAWAQQVTFDFVGYPQTWVVPENVTTITVDVRGAQGGGNGPSILGGKGGRLQTTIAVTPSETLFIYVGGRGGDVTGPNTAGPGGFNGGGTGGIDNCDFNGPAGGGGGASDIRQGGNGLANRVVVAGGGGGSECCGDGFGGDGGGSTGAFGNCSGTECACAGGGGGGTQLVGGAGGGGCGGCNGSGAFGSLGQGGMGGNGNRAGGGGGGGYYGGGGGGGCCLGAGGGGGSSYSAGTNTINTQGYQTGDGQIVISYIVQPPDGFDFPVGYPNGTGWSKGSCFASSCQDLSCWDGLDFLEPHQYLCCGCILHPGEDWNKESGSDCDSNVHAVADGRVIAVPENCCWGTLVIRHDNIPVYGTLWSVYGHLANATVGFNANVKRGDIIGHVGSTTCTGSISCHLHFEIRKQNRDQCFFPNVKERGEEEGKESFINSIYLPPTTFIKCNRPGETTCPPMLIQAHSPVSLIVLDPLGDSIAATFNTISGANYDTTTDSIFIPFPVDGTYNIRVVRDTSDQSGESTYTLTFQFGNNLTDTLIADAQVPQIGESHSYVISTCTIKPGDSNASGNHTLADIISTVNYIFNKPGFPSCPSNSVLCWLSDLLCRGDWNGSSTVTLSDVIQGVNYIFNKPGGPWNPVPSGTCCLPVP